MPLHSTSAQRTGGTFHGDPAKQLEIQQDASGDELATNGRSSGEPRSSSWRASNGITNSRSLRRPSAAEL